MKTQHVVKVKFIQRIGTKILFAALLALLVSLITENMIAKSIASKNLTETGISNLEDISGEKSNSLEQYIKDQKAIAQLVQTNSTVIEQALIYKATGQMDPTIQAAVSRSLTSLFDNTGHIYENLFVTFQNAGYADCLENQTLHDVSEENFYHECQQNGYYFGNNVSPVTGRPVYVIAYAIYSPFDQSFLGTVNMSIDMAAMGNDVVNDASYDVTVLDLAGNIIATNGDPNTLLTNIAETDQENFKDILERKTGHKKVDLSKFGLGTSYIAFTVSENFITEVSVDEKIVVEPANKMGTNLNVVALILGIIATAVITIIILIIINPLKKASSEIEVVIHDLEAGHGDLSKPIAVRSSDEIGLLVSCVNNLTSTLAKIISSVQVTTNSVAASSTDISSQIERAELEVTNVSSTMEQMSASSEETSASLSQVMVQVDGVADLVLDVNKQSISQAHYAENVVKKVAGIQKESTIAREKANIHLKEVTETLRKKIDNAKKVQEIANLTDEILSITSQTNLLSLNASIEAARAGEAGRGFAVVADEIRQLADSSEDAANRIQEVTASVISSVEDLAAEAERVTEFMIQSNEENHNVTENLTQSYSQDISTLAESMTTFRESSDEIQNSMAVIKEAIEAVNVAAEETAQGISNVAQSTIELSNELQAVVGKTSDNVSETNSLTQEINRFKVE